MTRQERIRNHIAHITDDFIKGVNSHISSPEGTAMFDFQIKKIEKLKRFTAQRIKEAKHSGFQLKDLDRRSWHFPFNRPSPRFSVFGDYDPYSLKE
tara:strand:+ start:141 stop:428 length:288 start_codon:yes stop_codon:yes gene_type:complete